MPRRSAASLSVLSVSGDPPRLRPSPSLGPAEAKIFTALVGAVPSKHFNEGDRPLLNRLCEAIALADIAAEKLAIEGAVVDNKPNAWIIVQEKTVRAIVSLTMRLRLCPQSRVDGKAAGRGVNKMPLGDSPWR